MFYGEMKKIIPLFSLLHLLTCSIANTYCYVLHTQIVMYCKHILLCTANTYFYVLQTHIVMYCIHKLLCTHSEKLCTVSI